MKMKFILLTLLLGLHYLSFSQYIGVRARYTETRLVDDSPNPPKRENRLILSFYTVVFNGTQNVFTPVILSNYDIWIEKQGLQFGNVMGGVLDSTGNNYPGYSWPAPKVVSYFNTLGLNYIDCNPNVATHYVVNGQELDCGFVTVSYWDMDYGTMQPIECFPAPNICLPYYDFIHPYYWNPGNVNFSEGTVFPGPPYNLYNFHCSGPLQLVRRGLLSYDTTGGVVLPVRFANVRAEIDATDRVSISWSNMTESDILNYSIEYSADGALFQPIGTVLPTGNTGERADYTYSTSQTAKTGYYRIKASEITGSVLYSNILVVKRTIPVTTTILSFSAYPNPVTRGEFTIRLANAPTGRYICSVINPEGQLIRQKMIQHSSGDLVRQIDMTGQPSGIYQVVLRSSDKKFTQRIVYVN
jgi:hypothetical protein